MTPAYRIMATLLPGDSYLIIDQAKWKFIQGGLQELLEIDIDQIRWDAHFGCFYFIDGKTQFIWLDTDNVVFACYDTWPNRDEGAQPRLVNIRDLDFWEIIRERNEKLFKGA